MLELLIDEDFNPEMYIEEELTPEGVMELEYLELDYEEI